MIKTLFTLFLIIFSLLLSSKLAFAQESTPEPDPLLTHAYRDAVIYAGPGETYLILGTLRAGIEVTIAERNRIGNWLHVQRPGAQADTFAVEGWVMTGYLSLAPTLRFSEVTVNNELIDADITTVESDTLQRLYAVPIIPQISEAMRRVYAQGQMRGNDSHSVTKIGDSLSESPIYLQIMAEPQSVLGAYDYLAETIGYYGESAGLPSVAAVIGLSSIVVFDPTWADPGLCEPNETPLACEYRRKQPSVSFIMFGPNDLRTISAERYAEQMRRIIEETLDLGIIPVVSTFSCDPQEQYWDQCLLFNLALVDLAVEYEIPLINLWSAARSLPDYGLDVDRVHLAFSGFRYLKYDTGHESWFGVSLQNLLALVTLDEIRRTLRLEF